MFFKNQKLRCQIFLVSAIIIITYLLIIPSCLNLYNRMEIIVFFSEDILRTL